MSSEKIPNSGNVEPKAMSRKGAYPQNDINHKSGWLD